jgi:hypothetical protein
VLGVSLKRRIDIIQQPAHLAGCLLRQKSVIASSVWVARLLDRV